MDPEVARHRRPEKRERGYHDTAGKPPAQQTQTIDSIPARAASTRIQLVRVWLAGRRLKDRGEQWGRFCGHADSAKPTQLTPMS